MDSYVLILAASSGKNLQLAHRFSESFQNEGMATEIVDLTTLHWPVYTPELDGNSDREPDTAMLSELILNSKALVVCAPEYNGVMPPALNNTIAWLSVQSDDFRRLFNNRTVLLATHSGGGGNNLLQSLKIQLNHLGTLVLPRTIVVNSNTEFNRDSATEKVQKLINLI